MAAPCGIRVLTDGFVFFRLIICHGIDQQLRFDFGALSILRHMGNRSGQRTAGTVAIDQNAIPVHVEGIGILANIGQHAIAVL